MTKVLIYVEGQTEETFIRDVLSPHLHPKGVYPVPILARTRRTRSGDVFKGGVITYGQVRREVLRLLQDASAALVTTMMDYYGLPSDFPGMDKLPAGDPYRRVAFLEEAFAHDIDHPRFLPFLTLHEFEALLFAQPDQIAGLFPQGRERLQHLISEISGLEPEEIDEGRATHPAARILHYFPEYRKALHGPLIASRIGLPTIRAKCPHFHQWISQLESLGAQAP